MTGRSHDHSPPENRKEAPVKALVLQSYYFVKPLIPRGVQLQLRRKLIRIKLRNCAHTWPIHEPAGVPPPGWSGWPAHKPFALVLTHDVEWAAGQEKCPELMKLEISLGFRSSFNFVPERYPASAEIHQQLVENGFEVGVHGLKHDGKLFQNQRIFRERARQINRYLEEWGAVGFRSPSMHHQLAWLHHLHIAYDSSTFDTDPFEPQADGAGTIFPFWVSGRTPEQGYVELPYTLPQDFTLFILMGKKDIRIWKRKLDWIVSRGGMVLLNVHPDYINFAGGKPGPEEYPVRHYAGLLEYIRTRYEGLYWHARPREVAAFVKQQVFKQKESDCETYSHRSPGR